jgi:hypothetical protein
MGDYFFNEAIRNENSRKNDLMNKSIEFYLKSYSYGDLQVGCDKLNKNVINNVINNKRCNTYAINICT